MIRVAITVQPDGTTTTTDADTGELVRGPFTFVRFCSAESSPGGLVGRFVYEFERRQYDDGERAYLAQRGLLGS